ncbi:MAG: glycine--tRNA ligase [Verrucomicrobiota bacterium]
MAIEKQEEMNVMEKLASLSKRRGFIFQSSEIYGGINGFWDYGPYGVTLRRAVEQLWWNNMVEEREDVVGLDSTVICHPRVWEASGHLEKFADMMVDCNDCKKRHRLDQMEDEKHCPACGSEDLTEPREFNLMMKTFVGPVFDEEHAAYLRAETCQPIFVDYPQVRITSRQKLPFGIAQSGKAFRNEITPRFFTFRSREFVQMEMEYFCREEDAMNYFNYWRDQRWRFYTEQLNFSEESLRLHEHEELAHYAKAAVDIEYKFPFGWGELEGVHHRGTYDTERHEEYSGKEMKYLDQETNERFFPTVIETSCGLDRICLALLAAAYDEDVAETKREGKDEDIRVVLRLPPPVAPVQVAVLPLSKKLSEKAQPIYKQLKRLFRCEYDDGGSIGKRYRRQDEIGTPFCITYDFDSLEDHAVTVRNRDTMEQERVAVDKVRDYLLDKVSPWIM